MYDFGTMIETIKRYKIFLLLAAVLIGLFFGPILRMACACSGELSILADVTTFFAFLAALNGVHRARLASEAQLLSNYNDKYFNDDMRKAIENLNSFKKSNKAYFYLHRAPWNNEQDGACFVSSRRLYIPDEVHAARRLVKGYFINALDLYEHGMLTEKLFMEILNKDGIVTLFHVVEALEWHHNPDYDASKFYRMMKYASTIYRKHLPLVQHFKKL